jgi:hypothetical protein
MTEQQTARYERRDVNPKWLTVTVLIVIAGIAFCLWLASVVLGFGRPALLSKPPSAIPATVPAPHLRSDPGQDLAEYQQEKRQQLSSAGWVDREAGIVHIPIRQAMDHVAEHGLPRWPAPAADSPAMRAQEARQAAGVP